MFDGAELMQGPPQNFLHSFTAMSTLNCVGCCCFLIIYIVLAVLTGEALKTAGFSQPPDLSEKWRSTQLPEWTYGLMSGFNYGWVSIAASSWSTFLELIIVGLLAYFAIRFRDGQIIKSISYLTGCCSCCGCIEMILSIVLLVLTCTWVHALEDIPALCNPATEGSNLKVVQIGTETTTIGPNSQKDCVLLMTELKTPVTLFLVSVVGCCCMLSCWTTACGFAAQQGLATAEVMDAEFGYGGSAAGSSYYG